MNILVFGVESGESRHFGNLKEHLDANITYDYSDEFDGLVEAKNPDVIVVSREWTSKFRIGIAQAKKLNIPVVYLMDGVIEWSYLWNNQSYIQPEGNVHQPLMSSDLVVIGQHPARVLASFGLADSLHVVGLPRLDGWSHVWQPKAKPTVLVATALTPAHDPQQEVTVRQALRDLKAWFTQFPSVKPVWRIAPHLAKELEIKNSKEGPIGPQLESCHALVTFPSTVALEGMLTGIPTGIIEYRPVPLYIQSAWEIRSSEAVSEVMHSLLKPVPQRLAYQRTLLEDELQVEGATARLADVLRKVVARGWPEEGTGHEHSTGLLDYQSVSPQLSTFSIKGEARLQYELDGVYKVLRSYRNELESIKAGIKLTDAQIRVVADLISSECFDKKISADLVDSLIKSNPIALQQPFVEAAQQRRATLQLSENLRLENDILLSEIAWHHENDRRRAELQMAINELESTVAAQQQTIAHLSQALKDANKWLGRTLLGRLRKIVRGG